MAPHPAPPALTATFSADWLAMRERLDVAARRRRLASMVVRRLPDRPALLDLGAGTGSLLRFLGPLIGRSQRWILADADAALLDRALARSAAWGEGQGFRAEALKGGRDRALRLLNGDAEWRIETLRVDLARMPRGLPLEGVDAVVCSALLDLVSREWLRRLAGGLACQFYAALSVDGRNRWWPRHPSDALAERAFRSDQRRDKGLGPALGIMAPPAAAEAFGEAGFTVHTACSDWRIPRGERRLSRVLLEMTAEAAMRAAPDRRGRLEAWRRARRVQAEEGRLAISIGHQDLLALPPR